MTTGNVSRFPWTPITHNPTTEQIRAAGDIALLLNARTAVKLAYANAQIGENAARSRGGLEALGDALSYLERAEGALTFALAEAGHVEAKQ